MSAFYDRAEQTARKLLGQFGYAAQIERAGVPTGPAYDPSPGVPTLHACTVVETGYSLKDRDHTNVQVGDKLGLISTAIDIVPTIADVLLIGSDRWQIIDVMPLEPGGRTLLYKFHARK